MTKKTVAETISNAAKRESVNRNSIVNGKFVDSRIQKRTIVGDSSQNIFTPGKVSIYIVSLYDEPITLRDFSALKNDIRATRGAYTIQYIPAGSVKRNPKFPYLIGQDLVRIRVTVSGPQHWAGMCDRVPELAWIKRNSTLSDEMFAIAKKHPGLVLHFGINFVKYCNKIESRAEELGIDIDHKPLVVYQWGTKAPNIDGYLNPIKTKEDYNKEIKEACACVTREEDI